MQRMKSPVGGRRRSEGGAEVTFRAFFEAERDGLLQLCWAVTLERELARDIAQETMARAWRAWDELSAEGSRPAAWCRTVALKLVRSHWRRVRTERGAVTEVGDPAELDVADLDLIDALRELSARQREAIVLHHLVDLPVHEVAGVMGIGASSVKEHLQRGRSRLERRLAPARVPNLEE